MKFRIVLLFLGCFFRFDAQNLTISSSGETGTSGTNWSVSGTNPARITSTNSSNINVSVIQGYINNGVDVIVTSIGSIIVNSDITKNSSGRFILKSGTNSITGTGKFSLGSNAQLLIGHGTTISNNIELISGDATIGFAPIEIEYLIVAGGGAGGVGRGGGGGAGGVRTGTIEVASGTHSITVGAGGAAVTNDQRGNNGSNSSAFNIVATGGGGGGGWVSGLETGANGGSGGGASGSPFQAGSGIVGQGNNGFWLNYYREPGGGGGGAGTAASSQDGGLGIVTNITGNSMWIGGGGGAGSMNGGITNAGFGGVGGGGNGTKILNGTASSGLVNTGGGGGGAEGFSGISGSGGSGIIVLRYFGSDIASGGVEYAGTNFALGYQVHEFKQIGTVNFSIDGSIVQGTISGQISGIGNLILNPSSGSINIFGNNTYSGTSTITSGSIQIGNNGINGSLGTGNIVNNGILTVNKSNTLSIPGIISGTGSIIKQGAGLLIFTQNNTYSGSTTISAGSIQLGDNTNSGMLGSGNIVNNGNLIFKRTDNIFLNNVISGTGILTKESSGRLNILNANTYTGGTSISSGIVAIYNSSSLGTGSISLSTNTSLLVGRSVATLSNNIILNGNANVGLDNEVEVLLVGGGGGASSGGGGGGGVLSQTVNASAGTYTVTVGAGGIGGTPINTGTNGSNGGNTTFNGVTAFGGGGGGKANNGGISGGSGGGAGADCILAGGSATQGFPGGTGPSTAGGTGASGGGGAGSAGVSGYTKIAYNTLYGLSSTTQNTMGGNGGNGIINSITGTDVYYGGGGGGGCNNNNGTQPIERAGQGGLGGGGRGANGDRLNGVSGTANTGGGGGGSDWEGTGGGSGGSGIAIIRYRGGSSATGGTVTTGTGTAAGYTIHTFTTSGNNTFTLNGSAVNLTGNISGSGDIIFQSNDGTITLSGNNTYTGNTTITSGTLILNNSGTIDSGNYSGNISNSGIFRIRSNTNHLFSGIISGTGELIKETTTSIVKLTGNNTYSGNTTISSGTIQIGDSTTTGSFGSGNIINNSTIIVKRSDDLTINNLISGTGTLTKENSNTLTLTQNNTYSGSNTINGGTLVLQNNAPAPTSKTFNGSGKLRIEPASASFTSAFTYTGWLLNSSITELTIGKSSNVSNITMSSSTAISGPISIFGGVININENLNTSAGTTSGNILLKGSADVILAATKSITTSGAPVVLWANSDNGATNGSIALRNGSSIITGSNSVPGGHIWLGGGSDGTIWNGLAVGSGYAVPGTSITPSNGGGAITVGVYLERCSLNSFGGNIKIAGDAASTSRGIVTYGNIVSINSDNGKIELDGQVTGTVAGNRSGILFGLHEVSIASTVNISSSASSGNAISISSIGRGSDDAIGLSGILNITASGGGNIVMNGNALGTGRSIVAGNYYHGIMNIFANSGNISLNGNTKAIQVATAIANGSTAGPSKINIGQGGTILSSTSDVILTADNISLAAGGIALNTSGKVMLEPSSNSFINALTFPITNLSIANTITGLTIGKSTNTANITIGATTSIAGPITAYGGTIAINENLSSSNGSTISLYGNSLTFGANKTVTSNNGQLIIAPQTASNTIGIGGATGTLSLPASYFSTNFSDGFSNIQIGSDSQTGNIAINSFTLRDNMTFLTSGSLTLGGKPVLGNNNITLGSSISSISANASNYFQTNGTGSVIRSIANNTNSLFPIGNIAYNPISINNKTGLSDTFSVNVLDTAYLNGSAGGAISNNYVKRTWNISKNTATANAGSGVDLSFTWNANEVVGTLPNPTLNHHNGSGWEIPMMGTSSVSGTTLTYNGYKGTFSPFAIGGSSTIALPVELKEFVANCQNDYIQIDWTTASEIRNKAFELFKSEDAQDWKLIYTTEGQGTKATETDYQFNDLDKKAGYYRLKDIDEDGVENWSQIIFAACKNEISEVKICPNPASDYIKVIVPQFENTTLKIINLEGKIIKTIPLISNQTMVSIKDLTKGIYMIEINNTNQKIKWIKK